MWEMDGNQTKRKHNKYYDIWSEEVRRTNWDSEDWEAAMDDCEERHRREYPEDFGEY